MHKLTDGMILGAMPKAKLYKMADGNGMYLLEMPTGSKYWRMNYRFEGKQKTLALGVYPDVSLMDARHRKDEALALLANGNDPALSKREARIEAAQQRALAILAITPPMNFRLSIADCALTIQTKSNRLTLTPEQTDAVRTFLIATPNEVMP